MPADLVGIVVAGLVLVGLAATELYGYLLFHGLAEGFSVTVACGTFMVVWNARRFFENSYVTVIGIGLLFIGVIDFLHLLAYKGMGVFSGYPDDLAIQLWIGARGVHSLCFLAAGLLIHSRPNARSLLAVFTLVTTVLLCSIFYWRIFPRCYVEPDGLTSFKRISEYVICLVLLAAMAMLWVHRKEFDHHVLHLLLLSLGTTVVSELAFTTYESVYGLANMLGHLLKIVAFYLIYKAVIETALVRPYNMLFRNLKDSEEELRVTSLRFHQMVDEIPDGVLVVDRGGVVRYMNPAAEALFETKSNRLVGRPYGRPLRAGTMTEIQLPRSGGRTTNVRMRVVKTAWDGQPSYLVHLHDITDQARPDPVPSDASPTGQVNPADPGGKALPQGDIPKEP